MAKRRELKDTLITFLVNQRNQCRPQVDAITVDRRRNRWDRRDISDRRSSIFPNQTDYSRRLTYKDRRRPRLDRRRTI